MSDAVADGRDLLRRLDHYVAACDLAADAAPVLRALCEEAERRRSALPELVATVTPCRGSERPMAAAVPVAALLAWARQVDDETDLDGVAAGLRGWAADPDADVHCLRYEALSDRAGPVECPGCQGSGDDRRQGRTCSLCAGTGELDDAALLALADELDALRADARGGPVHDRRSRTEPPQPGHSVGERGRGAVPPPG